MKLKKFLNEKDIVGANKIYTKEELKLKKLGIIEWEKLEDGTYEAYGDFSGNPKDIPFKIKILYGNFTCRFENLTTLKGCPEIVNGHFDCSHNKLKDLKYSPKIVAMSFNCSYNQLENLNNGPKKVLGNYSCHNNLKKFNKEYIKSICNVSGKIIV